MLTMGQFSKVLLAIHKGAHSTTEDPAMQTRLRWVEPGLWAQTSHPSFRQLNGDLWLAVCQTCVLYYSLDKLYVRHITV